MTELANRAPLAWCSIAMACPVPMRLGFVATFAA